MSEGTEPRLPHPQDPEAPRPHSSGRRQTHPRPIRLAGDPPGDLRGASGSAPGSQHDLSLTGASGRIRPIPASMRGMGEAGFDGLQKDDPDRSIRTRTRRGGILLCFRIRSGPLRNGLRGGGGWSLRSAGGSVFGSGRRDAVLCGRSRTRGFWRGWASGTSGWTDEAGRPNASPDPLSHPKGGNVLTTGKIIMQKVY